MTVSIKDLHHLRTIPKLIFHSLDCALNATAFPSDSDLFVAAENTQNLQQTQEEVID